jgi:hypothetical protein
MATQLKIRRGTTAEHASFTGAEGEITLDTTKDTLVAHDNYTAGGRPMLREDLNNLAASSININKLNASGSAFEYLRMNAAGNALEFASTYGLTVLNDSSSAKGSGAQTRTLSESMANFKILWFIHSGWNNIWSVPVGIFRNNTYGTGDGHMLDSYTSNHSYAKWVSDTSIFLQAGSGNVAWYIFGQK